MKKVNIICAVVIGLLLPVTLNAQHFQLLQQDSILFTSKQNDTTWLKENMHHPRHPIAKKSRNRLGYLYFKQGKMQEAISCFTMHDSVFTGVAEEMDGQYFMGRIYSVRKMHDSAKIFYKRYLQFASQGDWAEGASYHLMKSMEETGDSSVVPGMRRFIQQYPNSTYRDEVEYRLVKQYVKQKLPEALDEMRNFLIRRKNSTYCKDVQFHIMKQYRERKDYANAETEGRKLLQRYPDCSYAQDVRFQIGKFMLKAGKREEARAYFRGLANNSQQNTETAAVGQFMLGEILASENKFSLAREAYSMVQQKHPLVTAWAILSDFQQAVSYMNEWEVNRDSTSLQLSETLFGNFLTIYPTDKRKPLAALNLVHIYRKQGRTAAALKMCDTVLQFNTQTMTNVMEDYWDEQIAAQAKLKEQVLLLKASIFHRDLGEYALAMQIYRLVIETGNDKISGYRGIVECNIHQQKYAEARIILATMQQLGGSYAEAANDYTSIVNQ